MDDPVIDKSQEQKRYRLGQLRAELLDLGYSIVSTAWLHAQLDAGIKYGKADKQSA